jgi:chemotaxis signal transduction protein
MSGRTSKLVVPFMAEFLLFRLCIKFCMMILKVQEVLGKTKILKLSQSEKIIGSATKCVVQKLF